MRLIIAVLCLIALPASAEVIKHYFHVTSGTGFFVNDEGDLLTNEHVVRGCSEVVIKGPHYAETKAEVRATDARHDLALVHAAQPPKGIALLRENIEDLRPGDPVKLIGYPGGAWKTGAYKMSDAALVSTQGPREHPEWIQFTESAQRGNSGGPLVDQSGNVIGVVVAMLFEEEKLYQVNRMSGEKTLVKTTGSKTSGAVGLAAAEDFLNAQNVRFRLSLSGTAAGDYAIESLVGDYLVNVQCRIPISEAEASAMPPAETVGDGETRE